MQPKIIKNGKDSKPADVFGQELWDYYCGKEVTEIVERNDGYISANLNIIKSYFSDYMSWFPAEKVAIQFASGRILDIGCGAGHHSLYLQNKGFDVLGIDKSPLAIKLSTIKGVRYAKVLPIEQIETLKQNKFDTILMFGHNFGLFGNFKKAQRLLKNFYQITSAKAVIIATTRDPHKTDLSEHTKYHKNNLKLGKMPGQIRMRLRHGKLISPWFDYLFVSQIELKKIIMGTGWRIKKFINLKQDASYTMILEKE